MTFRLIDPHAIRIPQESGLLPCLYIPIAARNIAAIEKHVGKVIKHLGIRQPELSLLIESYEPEVAELRLPIWNHHRSALLHDPYQVWVHVDYTAYRRSFIRAFPESPITGLVLDHIMNRRVARIKGFHYVRILPISREANSSHGGLAEIWDLAYHSSARMVEINSNSKAMVQYADLSDIVKMLDMQGGGSVMDNVNTAQALVDLPKDTPGMDL